MKKSHYFIIFANLLTVLNSMAQESNSFVDSRDGKVYKTLKIGTQIWMAENLAYLPKINVPDSGSFYKPFYYVSNYRGSIIEEAKSSSYYRTYGVLYNLPAALHSCPVGWHLPSNGEWKILIDELGGEKIAGSKLMDLDINRTNPNSFKGLLGGFRFGDKILGIGNSGSWWSSTISQELHYWSLWVDRIESNIRREDSFTTDLGSSVRCLKDYEIYNAKLTSVKHEQGSFTDPRDRTTYKTVKIGTQTWMAENLSYLPSVSPPSNESCNKPIYFVYDYNGQIVAEAKMKVNYLRFGVLYNWSAAVEACPVGWHLPSEEEYEKLEIEIGFNKVQTDSMACCRGIDQGILLKSTNGWINNMNGNDGSGLSCLPGGLRWSDGKFHDLGNIGVWWTSQISSSLSAWTRVLTSKNNRVCNFSNFKYCGFSVRCIED